jgi:hypothetical protein
MALLFPGVEQDGEEVADERERGSRDSLDIRAWEYIWDLPTSLNKCIKDVNAIKELLPMLLRSANKVLAVVVEAIYVVPSLIAVFVWGRRREVSFRPFKVGLAWLAP